MCSPDTQRPSDVGDRDGRWWQRPWLRHPNTGHPPGRLSLLEPTATRACYLSIPGLLLSSVPGTLPASTINTHSRHTHTHTHTGTQTDTNKHRHTHTQTFQTSLASPCFVFYIVLEATKSSQAWLLARAHRRNHWAYSAVQQILSAAQKAGFLGSNPRGRKSKCSGGC